MLNWKEILITAFFTIPICYFIDRYIIDKMFLCKCDKCNKLIYPKNNEVKNENI